jgi:cytoskeletal protein CcmA (bactofilin family)
MRLLLIAAALPLAACQSNWEKQGQAAAQPSGTGATRSYAASGFTGVELRGPDDVQVKVGPAFAVTAEGDPEVLDQLDIKVVGSMLRVERKRDGGSMFGDRGARVLVTMPALAAASIAGSGDMSVDRVQGDFDGNVAGSGNLRVGDLRGGNASLQSAGSGDMQVAGTAAKLSAAIAGSGEIDARGLTATSADVSVAGSGNVRGTVKGQASVSIVGSGDVELGGGARCSISSMGSGEARCS